MAVSQNRDMTEFTVCGGYDAESGRGHVGLRPPPESSDIRQLGIGLAVIGAPLGFMHSTSGTEITFPASRPGMVAVVEHDICHDLINLDHRVILEEGIRTLGLGERLLSD